MEAVTNEFCCSTGSVAMEGRLFTRRACLKGGRGSAGRLSWIRHEGG